MHAAAWHLDLALGLSAARFDPGPELLMSASRAFPSALASYALRTLFAAVLSGGALLAAGCPPTVLNTGKTCSALNPCEAGLVCVEKKCVAAASCSDENPCPDGQFCDDGTCATETTQNHDGVIAVSTRELDFGSPVLAVPVQKTVLVRNQGRGTLTIERLDRGIGTSMEYTWETPTALPVQLGPDEAVEITVTYTLADGLEDLGAFEIVSDAQVCDVACDTPERVQVELLSEFKGSRNLLMSPETLDLGFQPAGTPSSPGVLKLVNEGTLQKVLTVTSIEVAGDTDQFRYTLPATPLFIAPNNSVDIPFEHVPTNCGDQSLTVAATANSDAPDRLTQTASIVGTSRPPQALVFEPGTLNFPETPVNTTSTESAVLRNVGCDPVTVTNIRMEQGGPFTVQTVLPPAPQTLPVDGTMAVQVRYAPLMGGSSDANTLLADNDQTNPGSNPARLPVSGAGYQPPSVRVILGPEDDGSAESCVCSARVPAAEVDLVYEAVGQGVSCQKPATSQQIDACAFDTPGCSCPTMAPFGTLHWSSARPPENVNGTIWIIDEEVVHEGPGQNGTFELKVRLNDDCLQASASANFEALRACCLLDCDGGVDQGDWACMNYGQNGPPDCATDCSFYAGRWARDACIDRGPVKVRAQVQIPAHTGQFRHLCTTVSGVGTTATMGTIVRTRDAMTLSLGPGVTEVAQGQACP